MDKDRDSEHLYDIGYDELFHKIFKILATFLLRYLCCDEGVRPREAWLTMVLTNGAIPKTMLVRHRELRFRKSHLADKFLIYLISTALIHERHSIKSQEVFSTQGNEQAQIYILPSIRHM